MRHGIPLPGRYVLERRAGAGGMGEVWKALDQETGQPVAIKVLPEQGPEDAARFAREARILAGLEHPHVVRYISHGLVRGAGAEGKLYLVMEWLEGEDLAARLRRGKLGLDESMTLALHVADALAFAHARGVVHRDLKPSNLFLPAGSIDSVKLLDFGVAHAALVTRVTRTGTSTGTPGYMAPEQARGEQHIDARADVFSLGCVLFECLTGEQAFGGEHAAASLTRVLFEEPPSARALRPEIPAALDALLARMLAKRPKERPLDGRAAAAALRALGEMPADGDEASHGEPVRAAAITGSEQRAVAIIFVSAAAQAEAQSFEQQPTVRLDTDADLLREAARQGGWCERLVDGSMAVVMSGAAVATDLCAQAARCALALRALDDERPIALTIGWGEQTGRSMGPVIERAARLSGAAILGDAVRLDGVAAGLLDARFDVREGEGGCFLLHDERAIAEGTRALLGKPTPCVGRERTLRQMEQLYRQCVEDAAPQAAIVTAPAGVGKSRVAHELLCVLRADPTPPAVWVGRGDPLRAGTPLGLLAQALRSATGVIEGEPLEVRCGKVRARVAACVAKEAAQRVSEFLGEMVGAPFPDKNNLELRAARNDAQLMSEQVRRAFLDFVAGACGARPVVLLLEDLHWGDKATVQFVEAALQRLTGRPFFVLALARPEIADLFPDLWGACAAHEIALKELSRKAIEHLALHVLGERAEPATIERLAGLSEGNAFYLEELLRWTAEGQGGELPGTVVAMVQSRLGALDEPSRRTLRAASIFGEVFWPGAVASLLGGAERLAAVRDCIHQLAEREICVRRSESRFPGEEEVAFRNSLLREGAYRMLTEEDRALGHRLAGAWLEGREAGTGEQERMSAVD